MEIEKTNKYVLVKSNIKWKDIKEYYFKNKNFVENLVDIILDNNFKAFQLKFNLSRDDNNFNFIVVRDDYLSRKKLDLDTYEKYIYKKTKFVKFYNLSGETLLICPSYSSDENQLNIKTYLETSKNIKTLFSYIAKNLSVGYLNTHGHGVSYLHVRIDPTPKYYSKEILHLI